MKRTLSVLISAGVLLAASDALVSVQGAAALPFNDDMVTGQFRIGSVMRPKAPGSVSMGSLDARVDTKEQAETLVNPLKGDAVSVKSGERLYFVNCYPCHGDITKNPVEKGPVAPKLLVAPPDITSDYYKGKSDGYIYGTIHLGGLAMMPALGHKLSPTEHWDIINFLRKVQNQKTK